MKNIIELINRYSTCYEAIESYGKLIVLFEKHNMALPIWGLYSTSINKSCNLFTFDTHSDTHPPFTAVLTKKGIHVDKDYQSKFCVASILNGKNYTFDSFSFDDIYYLSSNHLNNTEQIKAAYDWKFISYYNVITSDTGAKAKEKEDNKANYYCKYYSKKNWVNEMKLNVDETHIILDFDLDFFTCIDDFNLLDNTLLRELINSSGIITIAKEPVFFDKCKKSRVDFLYTNQRAKELLLKFIKESIK